MPVFDAGLMHKYDKSGPRYTSYPTAVQFHDGFGETEYREHAAASNEGATPAPLSLYFHIPFCATVCYYCACNKIVTKNRDRAVPYVEHLKKEIALQAARFDSGRPVEQLHWGGGTPTFLNHEQMRTLMLTTGEHFSLRDDDEGEYSIEVDPRTVDEAGIGLLRELAFNRISLGVQDFDPRVQKAVNRIQSEEQTLEVVKAARRYGFKSVSMDLIYGLPFQTVDSFCETLRKVIAAAPDRLSVFNYAHLPERFKTQRQIDSADLPAPGEKLSILQHTIELLNEAGYIYVGMDHFARPDDELCVAQRNGSLCRNFQGYSTHGDCDVIGMGITGIGMVGDSYAQNVNDVSTYYARVDAGQLPVYRGIALTFDDRLRREVITQLICHLRLDTVVVEERWGIRFEDYFADELARLEVMGKDDLIEMQGHVLSILPLGRLLVRNICMVFDKYLGETTRGFSKVI